MNKFYKTFVINKYFLNNLNSIFNKNNRQICSLNRFSITSRMYCVSTRFKSNFQDSNDTKDNENRFKREKYIPIEDDLSYSPKSHKINTANVNIANYSSTVQCDFTKFNLPSTLLQRLTELGYEKPFPIQEATLQHTLAGRDVVGKAITGSGKTLAFAIPIICKVLNSPNKEMRYPKCLVLSPTRELCTQLKSSIQELEPSLKCIAVYGGTSVEQQIKQLNGRVDIVCATPGRLKDLLQRKNFNKDYIELVCLDEADELLTPNFLTQIEDVLDTDLKRQMLFFSATINENVEEIINKYMTQPLNIDLTKGEKVKLPENVKHFVMKAPRPVFSNIIQHLIEHFKSNRCIVFTRSKRDATILNETLSNAGLKSCDLHSDHSQSMREKTFRNFRRGRFDILVATDVASRGIDVPEVDLIIQVSVPPNGIDYYIHRSGRTGRGGRPGVSVILHSGDSDERNILKELNRLVRFTEIPIPESLKELASKHQYRMSDDNEFNRFNRKQFSYNRFDSERDSYKNRSFSMDRNNRYQNRNSSFNRNQYSNDENDNEDDNNFAKYNKTERYDRRFENKSMKSDRNDYDDDSKYEWKPRRNRFSNNATQREE